MSSKYPYSPDLALLEFDEDKVGVFDAAATQPPVSAPLAAVGCYFPELIEMLVGHGRALLQLPSQSHLWEVTWNGTPLGVFYPGIGSPLATASLERVVAAGCNSLVFCGGAGAVVPELALGHVVIPTSAVRDEGTSFHYAPAAREITCATSVVETLATTCEQHDIPYTLGKTWTTDGLFRETQDRVARRRAEGCIVVECEAAALFAAGQFRQVDVGVLLYAGDDVSGEIWDERGWKGAHRARQTLFNLAAESAIALATRTS